MTKQSSKTRYLIFATEDNGKTLRLLGSQEANDADSARRKFLTDTEGESPVGVFAAVAASHFKLVPTKPKKITRIVHGDPIKWPVEVEGKSETPADRAPVAA